MNGGAVAVPLAFVPTRTALAPLEANVPLGPLAGAANVIGIPASGEVSGQPFELASVTWSGSANAEPSFALCGVPPTSVSVFGAL